MDTPLGSISEQRIKFNEHFRPLRVKPFKCLKSSGKPIVGAGGDGNDNAAAKNRPD